MHAICVNNDYYKTSLILGKKYEILQFEEDHIRIVDESGEDYLYSKDLFDIIDTNEWSATIVCGRGPVGLEPIFQAIDENNQKGLYET